MTVQGVGSQTDSPVYIYTPKTPYIHVLYMDRNIYLDRSNGCLTTCDTN